MGSLFSSIGDLLAELRRRNVYRVAVTYVIVGFFVVEAADVVLPRLGLPPWTVTLVIALVGLGFPIALVLAWALEVTPEGVQVEESAREETGGSEEIRAPTSTTRDLWVGASVLVLLLLGGWWLLGGRSGGGVSGNESSAAASGKSPKTKEHSIAVLPFQVSGAGSGSWRDGMVTMLSINLDGAAGLRAIADRTVFAAWQRRDSTKASAEASVSTEEAVAVAREVGAEYAIVGSAVQLGKELRLVAEVRRAATGERLGSAEVEGAPDSITALTDRLTRKIIGVLLERSQERIPSVDLASLTTESLAALKSYLKGERHFRVGEYIASIEDFEAAIRLDSSFALAYARLAAALGWSGQYEDARRASRRAYVLSDRLPRRERWLAQAKALWYNQGRSLAAADKLRQLTEAYPDDPTVWYYLGEVLYHGAVPRGIQRAEKAFRTASRLDPSFAQYHHHLVQIAIAIHRDSVLAARRLAAHPDGEHKQMYRLALDLVFGSAEARQQALSRLDSLPRSTAAELIHTLRHPVDGALEERALRKLRERTDIEDDTYAVWLVLNSLERGELKKALTQMRELQITRRYEGCLSAMSMSLGVPVPDSTLHAGLGATHAQGEASVGQLLCTGIYLIEKGQKEELRPLMVRLKAKGRQSAEREGSEVRASLNELKGYRAWRAGNLRRAATLWAGANASGRWGAMSGRWGAIWRGDLYRKLGKLKKAEGWYLAAWNHPVAHERLGRLYEKMGRLEKAAAAYQRFIEAWENADPELQGRVRRARRRLEALREKQATE